VVELELYAAQDAAELGPYDPQTLETRRLLADQKLLAGDIEGGLTDYNALISDCTRVYGPTHEHTFEARRHHAFALERTDEGIGGRTSALRELLAQCMSARGPDDPLTMRLRVDVAVYCDRSRAELDRVLTDQVRVLGADHPDVGKTRSWLMNLAG
jgi:hypothetical protein